MALPRIGTPTYETEIPSTKQKIEFRPFLVKEEKILLLALETGDKKTQYRALKEILKNCITTSGFDVNKLAVFDVEYLFIQIRGKSVGESLEPIVVCPQCKTQGKLKINLADIKVNEENKVEVPYKVMLSDKIGITMVYPNMEMMEKIDPDKAVGSGDTETVFKIIAKCIESIFDGEEVYDPKQYSEKELIQFIEETPTENFKKVVDFISNMPRVEKKVSFNCPKCSEQKQMVLRGVEDFFGSASPTTV
jgi:Zn ribbon nucleic-acid-binding protein